FFRVTFRTTSQACLLNYMVCICFTLLDLALSHQWESVKYSSIDQSRPSFEMLGIPAAACLPACLLLSLLEPYWNTIAA
ncbi:hypothetical protein F4604DRAFT_1812312, partial [Suillus subluteus]